MPTAPHAESSHPAIAFTVDGRQFETKKRRERARDLLRIAGLDPRRHDLGECRGGQGRTIKLYDADDLVVVRPGALFLAMPAGMVRPPPRPLRIPEPPAGDAASGRQLRLTDSDPGRVPARRSRYAGGRPPPAEPGRPNRASRYQRNPGRVLDECAWLLWILRNARLLNHPNLRRHRDRLAGALLAHMHDPPHPQQEAFDREFWRLAFRFRRGPSADPGDRYPPRR